VQGEALEQGPERLAVRCLVQSGQHLVLGLAEPLAELVQQGPAVGGGHDPPGPAVGRVGPALDQAGLGQAVQQVGHHGAGAAGRQAPVVAGNIRALITGEGELARYEPPAASIIVPIGPDGGAGQRAGIDDLLPAETVAELKGRDMMVGRFAELLGLST
jgi:hypothetical protein